MFLRELDCLALQMTSLHHLGQLLELLLGAIHLVKDISFRIIKAEFGRWTHQLLADAVYFTEV